MSKGQPRALELHRRRQDAARRPTQKLIAKVNEFQRKDQPVADWDSFNFDSIHEPPAETAKRIQWEHIEQVKVVKWWRDACAEYLLPEFALFAIPNAGKRSLHVGASMQAEGMRKGAPDLLLAASNSHGDRLFYGLFVEMKRADGGTQSDEQKEFEAYLSSAGYRYALCHGAESAINTICEYLK